MTTTPPAVDVIVEAVARAMFLQHWGSLTWADFASLSEKAHWRKVARAAIAAHLAALAGEGFKVLGREPTEAMVKDMHDGPLGAVGEVPTAQSNEWLREMWRTAWDTAQ